MLLLANTIKDEERKVNMLFSIADKYLELGQTETATQLLSQALEVANMIEIEYRKADALSTIVSRYLETEQKLNLNNLAYLSEIVQTLYPVSELWK